MKIKLIENQSAEWKFFGMEEINLYKGQLILYRESKKYGYRFNVILLDDKYYVTQALYNPAEDSQSVSVHLTKSVNDAKAVLNVMIQFIKQMREPAHECEA